MKYQSQEKWQQKVGLKSKSYKLKVDVVKEFAEACEIAKVSQAEQLTKMMNEFINQIKGDKNND